MLYIPLKLLQPVSDVELVTLHWYTSPSLPPDMTSVVAVYTSLPRYFLSPSGCILLLMSAVYPSGPERVMSRALPPVEVHLTLNVAVPSTTLILTVTAVTVRKCVFVWVCVCIARYFATNTHWGRGCTVQLVHLCH